MEYTQIMGKQSDRVKRLLTKMPNVIIELPCYGIVIQLDPNGGSINNDDLYEVCPHCKQADCVFDCERSKRVHEGLANYNEQECDDEVVSRTRYNAAADGIMSMTLAAACAGVDIKSAAFVEAIETAIQSAGNNT
jgi:hypothetical protein